MKTIAKKTMFALCAMICAAFAGCDPLDFTPTAVSSEMKAEGVLEGICAYGTNEALYYLTNWKLTESGEVSAKKYSTLGQSGLEILAEKDGVLAVCFGGGLFIDYADTDKGTAEAYIRICHKQSGIIEDYPLPLGESFRDAVCYSVNKGDIVYVQVFMKMNAGCNGETGDIALRATACATIQSFYTESNADTDTESAGAEYTAKANGTREADCGYDTSCEVYVMNWGISNIGAVFCERYSKGGEWGITFEAIEDGVMTLSYEAVFDILECHTAKGRGLAYVRICHNADGKVRDYSIPNTGEKTEGAVSFDMKKGEYIQVAAVYFLECNESGEGTAIKANFTANIEANMVVG